MRSSDFVVFCMINLAITQQRNSGMECVQKNDEKRKEKQRTILSL